MTLPAPNLDDRDFKSLIEEARTRIPAYTPEWTDFNESDPGMTLVQLHAWLTETLLYRVNRLPDLAYVNFLNLLGTRPKPARAAQADLTFTFAKLDKADDPLTLLVPKATQVGVDDPNLAEPLTFETDETLRGINAAVAAIWLKQAAGGQIVGSYVADEAKLDLPGPFRPFGPTGEIGAEMRVGLLLRPYRDDDENYMLDRFPEGELNLMVLTPQVFEKNADGALIEGPFGHECAFPWDVADASGAVIWEAYTGTDPATDFENGANWTELSLRGDDTGALGRSGHVYLDIPPNLPQVDFRLFPRTVWQDDLGLTKPPASNDELVDDLDDGTLAPTDLDVAVWKDQLGLADPPLADLDDLKAAITAAGELNFAAVEPETWTDLGYSEPPVDHPLVWLRVRQAAVLDPVPEVSALVLNTIRATAATTRATEVLGTSAGRPNQTFRLQRSPVLIDPKTGEPDIAIQLVDTSGEADDDWMRGEDFFGADRATRRYLLDPISGTLTFGDGVHGTIPVAGTRIVATGYRVGGGAIGNVAAGTIAKLKSALPQVKSVTNLRAAAGGADAETLDEAKLRAPELLRTRDRAVAAEDFADLALRTPEVDLKTAFALPLTRLEPNPLGSNLPPVKVENAPGAVTVVVLPVNKEPTPQPSEDQLRLICAWLNDRRLITTELYVTGPDYVKIDKLEVQIIADQSADLKDVTDRAANALALFFHPLKGGKPAQPGEEGAGWPIGGDIYVGDVFDLLLSVDGVERVADLKIALETAPQDDCVDLLEVDPGTLVHLPAGIMKLDVRYGRDA